MSRKPRVVTSAVLTPLRSIRALATSVVPWMTLVTRPGATPFFSRMEVIPVSNAPGRVVRRGQHLSLNSRPLCGSSITRSVKVPPDIDADLHEFSSLAWMVETGSAVAVLGRFRRDETVRDIAGKSLRVTL